MVYKTICMPHLSVIVQQHFMKNVAYVMLKNVYQIINSWFGEFWDLDIFTLFISLLSSFGRNTGKSLQLTIHLFLRASPFPSPVCLISPSL